MKTYSVFNVANWFLEKSAMSPKKLQKLTYYAQAWAEALFSQDLISDSTYQAWAHGPVSPELYREFKHYGWQDIDEHGKSEIDDEKAIDLLESVWLTYGDLSANELEALTHLEMPWRNARQGLSDGAHCETPISKEDMKKYYSSVYTGD